MNTNTHKLLAGIAAMGAVVPAASAHAGLSHTYNGVSVTSLILVLWIAVGIYEEIGDTVLGHWILFSAVFTAIYVPAIHPHVRIDQIPLSRLAPLAVSIILIGAVTKYMHQNDYLPRNRLEQEAPTGRRTRRGT